MKLLPYLIVLFVLVTLAATQMRGQPEIPPTPTFSFSLIDDNGREINLRALPPERTQVIDNTSMPPLVSTPECPAGHILNTSPSGAPCIMIRPPAINPPPHP